MLEITNGDQGNKGEAWARSSFGVQTTSDDQEWKSPQVGQCSTHNHEAGAREAIIFETKSISAREVGVKIQRGEQCYEGRTSITWCYSRLDGLAGAIGSHLWKAADLEDRIR